MRSWKPPVEPNKRESAILRRLDRTRKLFKFLRLHRHEIFSDEFQAELTAMYRQTGAGERPVPPAVLCLVVLLQAYLRVSDAEAVELAIMDARWGLVLDCLGADEPPFSQGALQSFRQRMIVHDMDQRLLERTIEVARETDEFDWKKLPKELRVAVDSRPFEGAGRVEDTFNLLGHAIRKLVHLSAELVGRRAAELYREMRVPELMTTSVKAALDVNWSEPAQKAAALQTLLKYVERLEKWLAREALLEEEPLAPYIASLARVKVKEQNLEVAASGGMQMRQGVAANRQISIEDPEMRAGRKSKSQLFNGYKEHVAVDLDTQLVVACTVTPGNVYDADATPALSQDMARLDIVIGELSVDRGYVSSALVQQVHDAGGEVLAKPWATRNVTPGLFTKSDFKIDLKRRTITCPAGQVEPAAPDSIVRFKSQACDRCNVRSQCTAVAIGQGRTVTIAPDEAAQKQYRRLQRTAAGRARLRGRTSVEHKLGRVARRQGPRARYRGVRNNLFDLRRTCALGNLEVMHARIAA
ncbi:MAG: IS1182 family transposase [Myxococcales bacterium]|nr:IS1182 family transposase [Myxococcales bacterium]